MRENLYKTIQYEITQQGFKWHRAIDALKKVFKQNPNGMNWNTLLSGCIDTAVTHIWNRYTQGDTPRNICVMAVGGYGRGACVPYSDVDIVFLYRQTQDKEDSYPFDDLVQHMVRALWDMGFKVGQSMHTADSLMSAMQADIILQTAVLTHRYIVGDYAVYEWFVKHLPSSRPPHKIRDFIDKKRQQQIARHEKFGVSQYILEPNIKQSNGAIRDLDMVYWICLYAFPKLRYLSELGTYDGVEKRYLDDFEMCMRFFNQVRTCMHLISANASDILYFDMQKQVAQKLGYQDLGDVRGVEIFMGDYYRYVSKSEVISKALLGFVDEYLSPDVPVALPVSVLQQFPSLHTGVNIRAKKLFVYDTAVFQQHPDMLVGIFQVAQQYAYDIHPNTLISIQQFLQNTPVNISTSAVANTALLHILQGDNPHVMLHYMNISGVLSHILPEWKTIYCQMQYDMYHDYTTDAHTIRTIKELCDIQQRRYVDELPVITSLVKDICQYKQRKRVLVVALLLHDIAKGLGGDHAVLGAEIAGGVCRRMGLDDLSAETVQWLVRHHLLLSHTADRRDITDLKTVHDFTNIVHGLHLLDLLAVLTTVDVRSVGKGVWTAWKHSLVMQVYERAKRYLVGDMVPITRKNALPAVAKRLSHVGNVESILCRLTDTYLAATPDNIIDWHVTHIANCNGWCVHMKEDTENNHMQIMVYTQDTIGITARITGVLTHMQMNIVGAEIFTFYKLGVVHTYRVQSVNGYMESEIRDNMQKILSEQPPLVPRPTILRPRNRSFQVQSQVIVNNQVSYNATMIEVHTKNRYGVMALITQALSDLGISIRSARITSYGEWVCDVFYVQDKYGFKMYRPQVKKRVRESIYTALQKLD